MGITSQTVRFSDEPPNLEQIAAAMTRLCGLPVSVDDSSPAIKSDLYQIHATVRFACAPREHVEVYSYRARVTAMAPGLPMDLPEIARATGIDAARIERLFPSSSPVDHRAVHLRGYVGEEGTLQDVAALALESLGGALARPMSAERRQRAAVPLTPALLRARHRRHNRVMLRALATLPFHVARALGRAALRRMSIFGKRD